MSRNLSKRFVKKDQARFYLPNTLQTSTAKRRVPKHQFYQNKGLSLGHLASQI